MKLEGSQNRTQHNIKKAKHSIDIFNKEYGTSSYVFSALLSLVNIFIEKQLLEVERQKINQKCLFLH